MSDPASLALMLTDTACYRNPHYHEASDLPGTLDYVRTAQVVQGLEAFLLGLGVEGAGTGARSRAGLKDRPRGAG